MVIILKYLFDVNMNILHGVYPEYEGEVRLILLWRLEDLNIEEINT